MQPGGKVCERCEQPIEGPAHAPRYNPAGLPTPSPIQGHATVLVGIAAAVALLAFGARVRALGVGPFRTEVVDQAVTADGAAVEVTLRVFNDGERKGKARCRITGLARRAAAQLRGAAQPDRARQRQRGVPLRGEGLGDAHDVRTSCA